LVTVKGDELHIPILKLKKIKALHSIVWELIKDFNYTAAQVDEVIKLLDSNNNGTFIQSATHRIINNRNWLIITPSKEGASQTFYSLKGIVIKSSLTIKDSD